MKFLPRYPVIIGSFREFTATAGCSSSSSSSRLSIRSAAQELTSEHLATDEAS